MEQRIPGLEQVIDEFGKDMVDRVLAGIRWIEQNKPDSDDWWLWRVWMVCIGSDRMPSFDMGDQAHHILCRVMDVSTDQADAIPERARDRWHASIRRPGEDWPCLERIIFAYDLGEEKLRLMAFSPPLGLEAEPDLLNLLWPVVLHQYMFTKGQLY